MEGGRYLKKKNSEINKANLQKKFYTFFSLDLPNLNPIKIKMHANLYIRLIKFCKIIRFWILVAISWILADIFWILAAIYWILAAIFWILASIYWILAAIFWILVAIY